MFIYLQSTGELYESSLDPRTAQALTSKAELLKAAKWLATGYSGHGPGRNQPKLEAVHNVGPIPKGLYTIGKPQCCAPVPPGPHGPYILPLTPNGHDAHGRTGLLCHGNNSKNDASLGCLIQSFPVRQRMGGSSSHDLLVLDLT